MSLVPLATFKQHIKVEDDETDEDVVIQAYLDGAEGAVAAHLCRPLIASDATPTADTYEIPLLPAVTAAILIMAGHLYANRETVVTGTISTELPMSVQFLLAPHRVWAPEPASL
jgi:hypothetical protein